MKKLIALLLLVGGCGSGVAVDPSSYCESVGSSQQTIREIYTLVEADRAAGVSLAAELFGGSAGCNHDAECANCVTAIVDDVYGQVPHLRFP